MDSAERSFEEREVKMEGAEKPQPKRRYTKPRLVEYGTLAKLTRAKIAGVADGSKSACL